MVVGAEAFSCTEISGLSRRGQCACCGQLGVGLEFTVELTRTGTKRAESLLLAPLKTIFSGLDRLSSYERDTRASQTDNRG